MAGMTLLCRRDAQTISIPRMLIREYEDRDASETLDVFIRAIVETASVDYTPDQIVAWATPEDRTLTTWNTARKAARTVVAQSEGLIVGFAALSGSDCVDMTNYLMRQMGQELSPEAP
jgi:hypothetical protein